MSAIAKLASELYRSMGFTSLKEGVTMPPIPDPQKHEALVKLAEKLEADVRALEDGKGPGLSTEAQSRRRARAEAAFMVKTWETFRIPSDQMKQQLQEVLSRAESQEEAERKNADSWRDPEASYRGEREPDVKAAIAYKSEWEAIAAEIEALL